jgi:selenide, water dikinase
MGPADLEKVLAPLTRYTHPKLLIGLQTGDDAAVYQINETQAIIQTVDFFPPVVDDAYTYGAIAAANSLSDVYAMGGDVLLALSVAAFPDDAPLELLSEIFRGAGDKVAEAGAVIAGGHTVTDPEPKYGLCVTGMIHPDHILTKGGGNPGDVLVLTKPLGTGVITTAMKNEAAQPAEIKAATESMLQLNRLASERIRKTRTKAVTDITGFGLLGHASEMAAAGGVGLRFALGSIPLLPGADRCAQAGYFPGGMWRNRDFLIPKSGAPARVKLAEGLDEDMVNLLFDPETSGGLLAAVPEDEVDKLLTSFDIHGPGAWVIGEVTDTGILEVVP